MLRFALTRLSRAFFWMMVGAAMVAGAQVYGAGLVGRAPPAEFRPTLSDAASMNPAVIFDGLREIRGALDR